MGLQVLVVDDSATIRSQVRLALTAAGMEVLEAKDGVEGLATLRSGAVDVVICDVNMPRMSGIEMVRAMSAEGIRVPTVMLTTEGQPALIRSAKEAGARGWIVKPFDSTMLVKAVARLGA
jgi:two-component system chemotaxis response regulator CheY